MDHLITILYANRNRDLNRIEASLKSLKKQEYHNFEVLFIDYGSSSELVSGLKKLIKDFDFVQLTCLKTAPLLWNKSKALNFGLKQVKTSFVFIADVDLIFHQSSTKKLESVANSNEFHLFKMAYLDKTESEKLTSSLDFEKVKVRNYGDVNGMILADIRAFRDINGYDEFFHFYGAEDEDLCARLINADYNENRNDEVFFFHNWHKSYVASESENLTVYPRLKNIRRINQYHFLQNKKNGVTVPLRQEEWGKVQEMNENINKTRSYTITNISAHVIHFLNEELPTIDGEKISVNFEEALYYRSFKYRIKKILGKQTQEYISMKEVNDMILRKIVFDYRNKYYTYKVADNLKKIHFEIEL